MSAGGKDDEQLMPAMIVLWLLGSMAMLGPVAQLDYYDRLGRFTDFCFMPNPSGEEKQLDQSRNGDGLYLVD